MDLWQDLVKAALVGTDRQTVTPPNSTQSPVETLLTQLDSSSPPAYTLQAAGVLALHRQASWHAPHLSVSLPEACEPDEVPCCSAMATQLLGSILSGEERDLLPEWLSLAAQSGQRVSPELLPQLLDFGRQHAQMRATILKVLGKRGQWLAAQKQGWDYARDRDNLDPDVWHTGTSADRLALLTQVCDRDPQEARDLIRTTWKTERAEFRSSCLKMIAPTVELTDAEWLVSLLASDRSLQVRRDLADLLLLLPNSELCQQVQTLTDPLLDLGQFKGKADVTIRLPQEFTAEMEMIGLQRKPRSGLGEKAWWFQQLLARVPPRHWSDRWRITPAQLLAARIDQWQQVVLEGWMLATGRYHDTAWAEAIVDFRIEAALKDSKTVDKPEIFAGLDEVVKVLPQGKLLNRCSTLLKHKTLTNLATEILLILLSHYQTPWSQKLTQEVIALFCQAIKDKKNRSHYSLVQGRMVNFACYICPEHYDFIASDLQKAVADRNYFSQEIDRFLARLTFRQRLHQAFIPHGS